ncbi:MAG: type I-C CRISPR-associated protein Cas8c/Csd1 [Chloroflexi bacterium]|nr:type I-C CRISPR-associated protein Cas8c/Csd1 [Chloroflexota bacterium]
MLKALYELAKRENLIDDPSFGPRTVNYRLVISDAGRPLGLVPLGDEGRGKKLCVPARIKQRSNDITAEFLVDKATYLFGYPKRTRGKEPEVRAVERAKLCHARYCDLVHTASAATRDSGLAAIERFLEWLAGDREMRTQEVLAMAPSHEWTGDEVVAIARDGEPPLGGDVHEVAAVRCYWARKRSEPASTETKRCLITGDWGPIAVVHPTIKRVPGATTSGGSLVAFNQPAFQSQRFEQGHNAPVSQIAADGYVRALNSLLDKEGKRRFRSGISLGDDSVIVFWTREKNDTSDVLVSLFAPPAGDDEQLRAQFEAAWKGLAPRDVDATKFYALTLAGNKARVVVRDWIETTAAEVKANVRQYFDDLELVGDGSPLSISRLIDSLQATPSAVDKRGLAPALSARKQRELREPPARRDKRGLAPALSARLFHAALRGSPFPRELLHAALARLRVPPLDREGRGTLRARVALIKATLLRLQPQKEISVSLDETNVSVPYLLGRLFAAMEKLQSEALGEINAGLRDRYFGSASAMPSIVFPRLLRVSAHHASKAEGAGRDWAERVKAQIIVRLPAAAFPRTLSLEDQGLFAVGYYHQREAFIKRRSVADGEPAS